MQRKNSALKLILTLALPLCWLLVSCETFKPENEIPSYIHIDEIKLNTTFSSEGTNSNKITDAWVYIDDQQIGVFELPATFPVIFSGKHKLKIMAGVKMNGVAATRISYPFYKSYEQEIDLELTKTDTIKPSVNYQPGVKFAFMEDFETAGIKLEKTLVSDTGIYQVSGSDLVFEGSFSGGIFLDDKHIIAKISSTSLSPFSIPSNSPVFLEMDYKNNQKFNVGIIIKYPSMSESNAFLTINPSAAWNKIYLNLTEEINNYPGATGYYLYITAAKENNIVAPAIFIDNLKIVQFK